jgi:flagellin-specific chaperone FliS
MDDGSFEGGGRDRGVPPVDADLGPEVDHALRAAPDPIRSLLFDAALRSLDRARRALAHDGDTVSAMGLAELVRARRMLDELRTLARAEPLCADDDGTIETLVTLYEFCSDRLYQVARTHDPELIVAVEDVLTELRDAFAEQ